MTFLIICVIYIANFEFFLKISKILDKKYQIMLRICLNFRENLNRLLVHDKKLCAGLLSSI